MSGEMDYACRAPKNPGRQQPVIAVAGPPRKIRIVCKKDLGFVTFSLLQYSGPPQWEAA